MIKLQTRFVFGLSTAAVAICLASPTVATAQEAGTPAQSQAATTGAVPAQTDQEVSTAAARDGEVLVTARRRTERLQDVPVAASVVGGADLVANAITNVNAIKFIAPQVSFDRGFTGSGASIAIRGVSSSSSDAGLEQSVLVVFDGMPTSRGRIVSDALFDVASIDILKGPQALFFGKNSPAGVVSIASNNPGSTWGGYARTGYEFTTDKVFGEAAVGGPLTDTFGMRAAVYASTSKGWITNTDVAGIADPIRTARLPADYGGLFDPAGKRRLGAEKNLAGRLTFRYENGDLDATLKLLYTHYESDGLQSLSEVMACPAGRTQPISNGFIDPNGDCKLDFRLSQGLPPTAVLANWPEAQKNNGGLPFTKNDSFLPTITINYKAGDVALTSTTSLLHYNFVNQGNADRTSYSAFYVINSERYTSFVQEVRAASSFSGFINFAAGGYFSHDRRDFINDTASASPLDPVTRYYHLTDLIDHNKSTAFSVFGQLNIKPLRSIEITGGARYTRETKEVTVQNTYVNPAAAAILLPVTTVLRGKRTEDNISPEVTVSWHPSRDIMIYGAYKTGYLSGGFSNPGNNAISLTIASDTYSAETVHGYEGGTKFTLIGGQLRGSLIGYNYTYKGLQLTSFDSSANPPVIRTQNAGNSVSRGVELEANYRPITQMQLRGSVNYNDAHFVSFPGAQCYALQTAAQGCVGGSQNLAGRDVYRSPDWILTAGGTYQADLGGGYAAQFNVDVQRVSSYFVGLNLNPLALQRGYTLLNAGIRLKTGAERYSISLIGRNLTNRAYGTLGVDKPAGAGEVVATTGEPRAVVLQLEAKF